MSQRTDDLVNAIFELPLADQLRVLERVARHVAEESPTPPPAGVSSTAPSLLGLFEDEPDLADEVCHLAYGARAQAHPRSLDE